VDDQLFEEGLPGNIRKAEHFLSFIKRFSEFLKKWMIEKHAESKPPLAFRYELYQQTSIESKPLR